MKAKAGVEFSFCIKDDKTSLCCSCDSKQRERCEAIASVDKGYYDDPRYASVDESGGGCFRRFIQK